MSEQVESKNPEVESTVETKQTNKTFSQSEVDRMVAEQARKVKAEFADYKQTKSELDKLLQEKTERELSEKTELEKKDLELQKVRDEIEKANGRIKEFELKSVKNNILSDPKYSVLPPVYKNNVTLSENEVDIRESADKMLENFKKDFEQNTGKTFGVPEPKEPTTEKVTANAEAIRDRMKAKFKKVVA